MRAAPLLLSLSLLGCFPHNTKNRSYAKLAEGGSLAAGIAMLAIVNSGADCSPTQGDRAGAPDCHTNATIVGDIGLGLILAGMVGFVATVSTSPNDDGKPVPAALPTAAQEPTPTPKLPGAKPATSFR